MTATINGTHQPDILRAIQRADKRWRQQFADDPADDGYLEQLAAAVHPMLGSSIDGSATLNHTRRELNEAREHAERIRADSVKLADQVAALTRQIGQLRADYATLAHERDQLLGQIEQLRHEGHEHKHTWPWPAPDEQIQPCACGKPWPRYIEYDEQEIEPDHEPWAQLFDRIRAELGDWGTPTTKGGAA